MPKFVLIDPSIVNYQGHYYEYALRVVDAAHSRGYQTVIAANRDFKAQHAGPCEVRRVYRKTFWAATRRNRLAQAVGRTIDWLRGKITILKIRLIYSEWGLSLVVREQWREYAQR